MRIRYLAATLVLAGCTVGPNYQPPSLPTPPAFIEPQAAGAAGDVSQWWHGFGDPEFDRLIAAALADNPNIGIAASRIRQARLQVREARAAGLPQISAMANATSLKFSKNAGLSSLSSVFGGSAGGSGGAGGSSGGGIGGPGASITTYAAGFDASWELDLFGGVRRQVEGARARVDAAVWNGRDAAISLAAEVADAYLQLRLAQAREAIARAEVARQSRSLDLLLVNAHAGLVPQGDFLRQRAQLATAQASIEPLIAEQHVQMHALAVLIAREPGALVAELTPPVANTPPPPVVPPGLPSDLLRRRPDIRAAERNLAAATADVGVATADLYPKFQLTGVAELISTALRTLFTGDSLQLTGSAAASFPLLDFGRRRAEVGNRKEAANQAYLSYQSTVLGAFRDVEDALIRIDTDQRRIIVQRAGVADAERSVAALQVRYNAGLTDLTAVLAGQQAVLQGRDALAQDDAQLRQDLVAFYKALGGGWSEPAVPVSPGQ